MLARDVEANERAEGVAALGAMVVDERFGSLLGGLQGDAMDDSGGQGFGGVLAGGVSVEKRVAGGGGSARLSNNQRRKMAKRARWEEANMALGGSNR